MTNEGKIQLSMGTPYLSICLIPKSKVDEFACPVLPSSNLAHTFFNYAQIVLKMHEHMSKNLPNIIQPQKT